MTIDKATRYWIVGDQSPDDLRAIAGDYQFQADRYQSRLDRIDPSRTDDCRRLRGVVDYSIEQVRYYRELANALERETVSK